MWCVFAVVVLLLDLASPKLDWNRAMGDEDRLAGSMDISCDFMSTERFVGVGEKKASV